MLPPELDATCEAVFETAANETFAPTTLKIVIKAKTDIKFFVMFFIFLFYPAFNREA